MKNDLFDLDRALSKEVRLLDRLRAIERLAIAYSGGVDSSYLAHCAAEALGKDVLLLLADSPTQPRDEIEEAIERARAFGWPLRVVPTKECRIPAFLANGPDRCYRCKRHLVERLRADAADRRPKAFAFGENADDDPADRPGTRALEEAGCIVPLRDVGLRKREIRELCRRRGLPVADKPSLACLATRFPEGMPIDLDVMKRIEEAEGFLKRRGYRQCRLRHHGDSCRIQLDPADFPKALRERDRIVRELKALSYRFVTLDLAGYPGEDPPNP